MTKPVVWLVGPSDDPCFRPAIAWLATRVTLRFTATVELSLQLIRSQSEAVHAIVVCALRPGEVDASAIAEVHAFEPLARLAMLLGTWCEGEVRSGVTVPGVKRIYWHAWQGQLPAALGLASTSQTHQALARTANEADWVEWQLRSNVRPRQSELVAICTRQASAFDMLADALAGGGFRSTWQLPSMPWQVRNPDVILWDGWPDSDLHARLPAESKHGQLILLDFPRLEDHQRAIALGASHILSPPFQLPDLWAAIVMAAAKPRATASFAGGSVT
jgi:hypothetical protein